MNASLKCLTVFALILLVALVLPVVAADKDKPDTTKGTIKSLTIDKNELVLTGTPDGKDMTLHVDDTTKVFLGDKEAKLADLKVGDELTTVSFVKQDGKPAHVTEIRCKKK